jgi:hypothetical protein
MAGCHINFDYVICEKIKEKFIMFPNRQYSQADIASSTADTA